MFRLSNPSRAAARVLGMLFLAGSLSCSKAGAEANPSASASPPVAASAAVSASPPPSRMKEYASPAAERLGVLAPGTGIAVGQVVPAVSALDLDGKRVEL